MDSSFIGPTIVVHGLLGNQIAIVCSKIVAVTQEIKDNTCRIFLDADPEPIIVQESWAQVMQDLTCRNDFSNDELWPNLLKGSEEESEEE